MAFASDKTRQGAAGVSTGYDIPYSARFNDDDSANLTWLQGTGNRRTWTWSGWVKRGNLTNEQPIITWQNNSENSDWDTLEFSTTDTIRYYMSGAISAFFVTNQVFRDTSAWYHICLAVDTTQATASNRVKLYVNGEQVTSFSTATYPSQNYDTWTNLSGRYAALGSNIYADTTFTKYLDGYLAEVNFVDGQALTPADFGETGDYGEWKPIAYAGSYGTNGFYLDFSGVDTTIIAATGGTIYTSGNYKYHKFTADGTFTVTSTQGISIVDALVIAGGGGGGGDNGGGGGAGGYLYTAEHSVSATAYSITVGNGGAGALVGSSDGVNGQNSVFSSLTATGGGFGGTNNKTHAGASGGSGGGGGGGTAGGGGGGTAGQGYAGGSSGGNTSPKSGGGGGGAGAVGAPGPSTGTGGIGSNAQSAWATITSSGDSGYYAGGGGAGHEGAGADNVGGTGGGGAGGGPSDTGVAGTANTGGGGGGANSGGAGGSGIVIIRYKFK